LGVALVAVLWAYDGWIEITYVGGEVTDPERNLPRSILLATVVAIVLYCLASASFAYVLSPAKVAASSLVASDAAQVTLGRAGAALVAVAIMIATLGSNNGIVLTAARIPYAMARDGLLPRWLAGVHPRFVTPVPSLVAQGVVAIALTWISTEPSWKNTYNRLFTYVVLAEFVFYAMSCGAVLLLRRREPGSCFLSCSSASATALRVSANLSRSATGVSASRARSGWTVKRNASSAQRRT